MKSFSNHLLSSVHAPDIHYSTDSIDDFIISKFCIDRLQRKFNTISQHTDINSDHTEICKWLTQFYVISEDSPKQTIGVSIDGATAFRMKDRNWATRLTFIGEPTAVAEMVERINQQFSNNPCYIRWVYDEQYLEHMTLPINNVNQPMQEMYPFLNESLDSYYDRYTKSSANILVLIGPPGTGKTTFIRGLLSHAKKSATLTYHEKILAQDAFFVNWLESDDMFLVLEDADSLLLPRKDGNGMMARFLNMGDGLMGFTNKKIVFSTNLPNVSDIDSALTRPGRCFDIMEFKQLSRIEATTLCDKVGTQVPDGDKFTVSEIFAAKRNDVPNKPRSTFGFI
jgi:hypothetical protein